MVWKSIVIYRKTDGLEVDCYVLLFLKDVKLHFNLIHVTRVSAQTFARGYRNRIQLGFPDFINRKCF